MTTTIGTTLKGRPPTHSKQQTLIAHSEREKPSIEIEELYTLHKIVAIAYESQYVLDSAPLQLQPTKSPLAQKKKYECGFVYLEHEEDGCLDENSLRKMIQKGTQKREFRNLRNLMSLKSGYLKEVWDLVMILAQLKHSEVVEEFLEFYDIVINDLEVRTFTYEYEEARRFWENQILGKVLQRLEHSPQKFPFMCGRLRLNRMGFEKYLRVTAYCMLAQAFNFSLNEYYHEALTVFQHEATRKKTRTTTNEQKMSKSQKTKNNRNSSKELMQKNNHKEE